MGENKDVSSMAKEHIAKQLEQDEKKLDSAVSKAQMLNTPVPTPDKWKTCWSCGKKVPLVTRDPLDGVLVCRTCYAYSQVASTVEDVGDVLESISMMVATPGLASAPDDGDEETEEDDTKAESNEDNEQA